MATIKITLDPREPAVVGESVKVILELDASLSDDVDRRFEWAVDNKPTTSVSGPRQSDDSTKPQRWLAHWDTSGFPAGPHELKLRYHADQPPDGGTVTITATTEVTLVAAPGDKTEELVKSVVNTAINVMEERRPSYLGAPLPVSLRRTHVVSSPDEILWMVIRKSTDRLSFPQYVDFIDTYLCRRGGSTDTAAVVGRERTVAEALSRSRLALPFTGVEAYRKLKAATEVFMLVNTGVMTDFPALLAELSLSEEERRTGHAIEDPTPGDALGTFESLWDAYLERVNGLRLPRRTRGKPVGEGRTAEAGAERVPRPGDYEALPYLALIRAKLPDVPVVPGLGVQEQDLIECYGIIQRKLSLPVFVELIWSYWHEEGMLVQTMNYISRRFQNIRAPGERDPLANLEIDPLRPLNNLLWGYVQDEQHRLSILRRAAEYAHEYGFTLHGKAVAGLRAADRRSKFLESFHNLLHQCTQFFRQDDDTTVVADGFPVLNSVKETHYLLAHGAHNQFGDMPSTSRQEMLMQMWLLARSEMREFLGGRVMVPYPEPWMDRVDAMKALQGWTDTSVVHFHDLAVFGERLLLSIRYGGWSVVNDAQQAANWARYWRPDIQSYIHAYRAVTGVDLTADITDQRRLAERYVAPSEHLRNQLALQRRK
ncbi:hypothetical protein [Myxococcus sp. RHSTA-1-4]|uniref:hypothetical protein n=1 Tax=Myxococcus sp. RHSTA-1-4 TaxID=2874601 RepID=UPI001CBAF27E|nr:hypothetical protein [Myxococcus sp. RHSTA-1-4]MBZ4422184.1 hypothetical protein [Myxococcus sp. RHSTA-1-4]